MRGLLFLLLVCITTSALAFEPFSQRKIRTVAQNDSTKHQWYFAVDANNDLVSRLIRELQDSIRVLDNYAYGIDTVASSDSCQVTIGRTYASSTSYSAIAIKDINTVSDLWINGHTTTSFWVHNANGTQIIFRWITIGTK